MRKTFPVQRRPFFLFSACMAAVILFSANSARAQGFLGWFPQVEASGTYSYMRANPSGAGGVNLNGASESIALGIANHLSAVADGGQYRFSGLGNGLSSNLYTFMAGPRYTFRAFGGMTAFAQVLAGGSRVNASSSGIQAGETGFAMSAGGGLDWPIRQHILLRVLQADYVMTRFENAADAALLQSHVRLSAGVVFRVGNR